MLHLFAGLDIQTAFMLALALLFVLFYEAINGFHDTANAVATVIYTRALRSQVAVVMAGLFNFLGVMLGGLSVAYAIVHLLPTDLLLNVSSAQGLAMMFSLLLAAIIWNFGTWFLGIPASSSHTLIGSIVGVGLANALINNSSVIDALNVRKMIDIFLSLLISPIAGMMLAGLMVFLLRRFWSSTAKRKRIHLTPAERELKDGKRKPPFVIRLMLVLSAVGVSFSHGANDGQKGIGLLMLVLVGIAPAGFVINMGASSYDITRTREAVHSIDLLYQKNLDKISPLSTSASSTANLDDLHCDLSQPRIATQKSLALLNNVQSYDLLNAEQRSHMRRLLMCVAETSGKIAKQPEISKNDAHLLSQLRKDVLMTVEYAPIWIIIAVALALSIGTMVGWKRVAVTIGEKIGKKGMTYAQGVSAQMTAAVSIGIASYTGMPVSTTHVLSSAVAGTMIADGGGVQGKTVKNILMAWVLTLPVTIMLSGSLYWLSLKLI